MTEIFDRWASIGCFCLPKYQINRHVARTYFGLQTNSTLLADKFIKETPRDQVRAVNGGNLFFDWTVVNDYGKVITMLSGGLDYDLSEAQLSENLAQDGSIKSIRCLRAGVTWDHLFSRAKGLTDWRDQIESLKPKVARFADQFRALKNFSTLYIVAVGIGFMGSNVPDLLANALSELRGPSAKPFRLLVCIQGTVESTDLADISIRPFDGTPDFPAYPWLGNAASWDIVFQDFALSTTFKPLWPLVS